MQGGGTMELGGKLTTQMIRGYRKDWMYRVRNWARPSFLSGFVLWHVSYAFSKLTGVPMLLGRLSAVIIKANGQHVDVGVLSFRSVTTAFCEFMVDQLIAETSVFGDYKYHDSGVGTTGENVANTDMETTDGVSRGTGTQVESSSVIYESVGTIAYTSTKAITEHGLFNTSSSATLMDRSVFSALNVVNGDSIQFTYDLTVTAGG